MIGYIIGFIGSPFWISLGKNGKYVGYTIAVLCWLIPSIIHKGQTLGKTLAHIKAVNLQNKDTNLIQTILRAFIIPAFSFIGEIHLKVPNVIDQILSAFIITTLFSFILFDAKQNRALHDYLLSTKIVHFDDSNNDNIRFTIRSFSIVLAMFTAILLVPYLLPDANYSAPDITGINTVYQHLLNTPNIVDASVSIENDSLTINVWSKDKSDLSSTRIESIIKSDLVHLSLSQKPCAILKIYGYDIWLNKHYNKELTRL